MSKTQNKLRELRDKIRQYSSVLVAYSGGVDSSLLLKVATETLGRERALGVVCRSDTLSEREFKQALDIAGQNKFNLQVIEHSELEIPEFAENTPQRCYVCKRQLFEHLRSIAKENKLDVVMDGSSYDDVSDYRPGMRAAKEFGIESPLKDLCFRKEEIRALAKELGLSNWDKPSTVCLASRFPYGTAITEERLKIVSTAEDYLHSLGLHDVRVRYHGDIARIEVAAKEVGRVAQEDVRKKVISKLKSLGFTYVTLDLEGFRSGSMNEPLARSGKLPSGKLSNGVENAGIGETG